jgi:hypothetical protein
MGRYLELARCALESFPAVPEGEISEKSDSAVGAQQVAQASIAQIHPRIRLIEWHLKEPPVALESCAVVTDPDLFAKTTLEQLRIALKNPKRWVGWSVPQLVDRLAQVGVCVEIEIEVKHVG